MTDKITATTWAEINLDNINFNLNNIKKLLKEDTKNPEKMEILNSEGNKSFVVNYKEFECRK